MKLPKNTLDLRNSKTRLLSSAGQTKLKFRPPRRRNTQISSTKWTKLNFVLPIDENAWNLRLCMTKFYFCLRKLISSTRETKTMISSIEWTKYRFRLPGRRNLVRIFFLIFVPIIYLVGPNLVKLLLIILHFRSRVQHSLCFVAVQALKFSFSICQ